MATPLKINNVGGTEIKQFTTAEENYIAYQIGLHLAADSANGDGTITSNSSHTTIGSYTNTFFNEPVGTHPSTSITSGSTSTTVYQNQTSAIETDSDIEIPLMWVDSGGQTGFKQMTNSDLNTAVDRYISTIFTNNYPGTFQLASSSPGPDYSIHLSSVFTDTRTDGTSIAYNIYRRDSYTAPSVVRPLYVRDNGGFDGVQAMADRQIKYSFGQRAKTRVGATKIGTYQLRSSTQGAPTDPGTWVSAGSATDTKQTTADQVYTRDSTVTYATTYTTSYTQPFTAPYTSIAGFYNTQYEGFRTVQYQRIYTKLYANYFTARYAETYDGAFTIPYTSGAGVATYTSTAFYLETGYTQVNLYTKEAAEPIINTSFDQIYTRVFQYAGPATSYTGIGNYTNIPLYNTDYVGPSYTSDLAYQKIFTAYYTGNFIGVGGTFYIPPAAYARDYQIEIQYEGQYTRVFQIGYVPTYTRTETFLGIPPAYIRSYLGPNFANYIGGSPSYLAPRPGPSYQRFSSFGGRLFFQGSSRSGPTYISSQFYQGPGFGFTTYLAPADVYVGPAPGFLTFNRAFAGNSSYSRDTVFNGPSYIAGPYTNVYARQFVAVLTYITNYSADYENFSIYLRNFVTTYEILYTGQDFRPATFYESTYSNDYTSAIYNSNYTSTYTSDTFFYLRNYGKMYDKQYINQYQNDFIKNYTRNYTRPFIGTYVGDYENQYETDYIGNFEGNFAGLTIQSGSQTEETYTLYVRIG